jgi:hypothetical protein
MYALSTDTKTGAGQNLRKINERSNHSECSLQLWIADVRPGKTGQYPAVATEGQMDLLMVSDRCDCLYYLMPNED